MENSDLVRAGMSGPVSAKVYINQREYDALARAMPITAQRMLDAGQLVITAPLSR